MGVSPLCEYTHHYGSTLISAFLEWGKGKHTRTLRDAYFVTFPSPLLMTPLAFLLPVQVSCFGTRDLEFILTPTRFRLHSKLVLTRGKSKNPMAGLEASLADLSPTLRMDRFRDTAEGGGTGAG